MFLFATRVELLQNVYSVKLCQDKCQVIQCMYQVIKHADLDFKIYWGGGGGGGGACPHNPLEACSL